MRCLSTAPAGDGQAASLGGKIAQASKRAPFTHVVRYRHPEANFTGKVDMQLDAAFHSTR